MHCFPLLLSVAAFGAIWVTTPVVATDQIQDCVLPGPDFPPPSRLSQSSVLTDTTTEFESQLRNITNGLLPNNTAWGVALFSSRENRTLYERFYTPPIDSGVREVNGESIFRIGSISKVFTVWSFLIEVGDSRFNDPITKYIPELANTSTCTARTGNSVIYDDINNVKWDEVTIGELASHAAGITRDATDSDLSAELTNDQISALGLPTLNQSDVPICGVTGRTRDCTRQEMLSYLQGQHPIFATAYSPTYSNIAFTLINYALEAITGKNLNTTVTTGIFDALDMKNSSFQATPQSGGVILGNASDVGWNFDLGQDSPSGSIYSSVNDMVKAGQAILQSSLLSPSQTRRWMKPVIQTGYLGTAVGAPWEIRYLKSPNRRMVQLYTKQGDLGNYHAALVLSPEHELGWVVLSTGTATPNGITSENSNAAIIRESLMNTFSDLFLPMAEQEAKQEAVVRFNGTYVDLTTNSSVTILGTDSRPGLMVSSLFSRGVQLIGPESPLINMYGAGQFARLYPSQLRTTSLQTNGTGAYDSRLGFKATYFSETQPGTIEDPCLLTWTALGVPMYGQKSLDDWVFELDEDGDAKSLDLQMLRLKLTKTT